MRERYDPVKGPKEAVPGKFIGAIAVNIFQSPNGKLFLAESYGSALPDYSGSLIEELCRRINDSPAEDLEKK